MFIDKLTKRQEKINSCLGVSLNPVLEEMPFSFKDIVDTPIYAKFYLWMEWLVNQVAPYTSLFYVNTNYWTRFFSGDIALYELIKYIQYTYKDIPILSSAEKVDAMPFDVWSQDINEMAIAKEGIGLVVPAFVNSSRWIWEKNWRSIVNQCLHQAKIIPTRNIGVSMEPNDHLIECSIIVKNQLWMLVPDDTCKSMKKVYNGPGSAVVLNSSLQREENPGLIAQELSKI
jgi:hypothetical protein